MRHNLRYCITTKNKNSCRWLEGLWTNAHNEIEHSMRVEVASCWNLVFVTPFESILNRAQRAPMNANGTPEYFVFHYTATALGIDIRFLTQIGRLFLGRREYPVRWIVQTLEVLLLRALVLQSSTCSDRKCLGETR